MQKTDAGTLTGTVKWFNSGMGYGFIRPDDRDRDVFVHISAVERAGLATLAEGMVVEYEVVTTRGRQSAEHIKVTSRNGNGGGK
jgi:cold shock protein